MTSRIRDSRSSLQIALAVAPATCVRVNAYEELLAAGPPIRDQVTVARSDSDAAAEADTDAETVAAAVASQ